jgi:hypothetical protein
MLIPGSIPVTGFIGPTDSNDTYAVTDAIYGIDGYRSVSATTARNAITTERRREGMLVYTQADQNVWQLLPSPWSGTDADWKLFISSAATNSLTATTGFLSLSGGIVSGNTSFTANLSANTLFINNTNIGNLFIALSGTNGNLVTGDIEISDDINLSWNAGADLLQYNSTSTNVELTTSNGFDVVSGGILSAGTNLYQIFATTGATITGNYLAISGGTVTGNTIFTTGLTANTLVLTENTNAPLNVPIFTSNPGTLTDGDVWILSAATGNAWLSVRLGGITKVVELS